MDEPRTESEGRTGNERRAGRGGPEAGSAPALRPVLRPFDVTMIVMGSIVGAGIFFTPASVAQVTGSLGSILLVWALGGVFAVTGAIVFAELGAMLPRAGGQYVFLREAFGRFPAFLFGWVLLTVIISPALAFVAGVFTSHVEALLVAWTGFAGFTPGQARAVSVVLIGGLTLLNVRGTRLGALVQNVSMLGKAGGIVVLVLLGAGVWLGWLDAPPPAVAAEGSAVAAPALTFGGLATALISVVFSYGGWQNVTAVASEVVRPERTLPLGILLGTALVVLLYLALNASLVAILGVEGLAASATPVASAAQAVTPAGGAVVAGLIALSTFAIVQALLMVAPRIFYAMATDGIFFGAAARVHPRWHTPWVAVCLLGGAGVLHVFLIGELGDLLGITTQGDAVFFALSALALFRLRRTRPDLPRPYRAQGYPVVPAIFLVFCAGMVLSVAFNAGRQVVLVVAGLFLVGGVLYAGWRR